MSRNKDNLALQKRREHYLKTEQLVGITGPYCWPEDWRTGEFEFASNGFDSCFYWNDPDCFVVLRWRDDSALIKSFDNPQEYWRFKSIYKPKYAVNMSELKMNWNFEVA